MSDITSKQLEIINGSLLGDGCLKVKNRGCNDNATFAKVQSELDHVGENKKDYMEWHSKELEPFSSSIGFSNRQEYEFRTKADEIFTKMEKQWYLPTKPKRTKVIPKNLKLTPLTLCIWFMDDGTNHQSRRHATIASMSFTKEENDFLIQRLKEDLDLEATTQKYRNLFQTYIGPKSYLKLIDTIKPLCTWKCFQYKHDLSKYKPQIYPSGELSGLNKLLYTDIVKIKELKHSNLSQKKIGQLFGVGQSTIGRILNSKRWGRYIEMKESQCQI